ncbi:hypothetical protein CUM72_07520 [Enterococcus durans]|nr:hypothetical protein CUM72_07520 [Enterococcus durans]TKN16011.1 hypothetical protein DVW83_11080 [Enterococcus sp. VV15]
MKIRKNFRNRFPFLQKFWLISRSWFLNTVYSEIGVVTRLLSQPLTLLNSGFKKCYYFLIY